LWVDHRLNHLADENIKEFLADDRSAVFDAPSRNLVALISAIIGAIDWLHKLNAVKSGFWRQTDII
jgi:hypothetical protein